MAAWITLLVTVLGVVSAMPEYHTVLDEEYHEHDSEDVGPPDPQWKGHRVLEDIDWMERGRQELSDTLSYEPRRTPAKNVILVLGDGMGISTQTAARIFKAQHLDNIREEDASLAWEHFHNTGLIKTYNTDRLTPDSAGTATAFLCGEKTFYTSVGVNQKVLREDCDAVPGNELKSILHHSQDEGKWTGIVTTTRVTHATPAASYAHSPSRWWENDHSVSAEHRGKCKDIARQLIEEQANQNIRVIMGGGRREFVNRTIRDPETNQRGYRRDGKNLIEEWKKIKEDSGIGPNRFKYINKKTELDDVDATDVDYLLGLFGHSHMQYEAERILESPDQEWLQPSLAEMAEKAIQLLSRSAKGYFLLLEGGRIDHGHHGNRARKALHDTASLSDAVQKVLDLTSEEDTLVVVTADHSHTFVINGHPALRGDILDLVKVNGSERRGRDAKPYTTLGYTNGPGFRHHRSMDGTWTNETTRRNLSGDRDLGDIDYRQDAPVPLSTETHGGEDVSMYARGPMSHLFTGLHEQHYITHAMMYASCVGWNKQLCGDPPSVGAAADWTKGAHTVTLAVAMAVSVTWFCL